MAQFFTEYRDAHAAALSLAKLLGRETGIEAAKEYTRAGFNVHSLPRPENRCGFELRCELVRPDDPPMRRGENLP